MTEFGFPSSTTTSAKVEEVIDKYSFGLTVSDFVLLCCSFILSYVIFFSPFLINLLSFLSPLFLTTTLLVLAALLLVTHRNLEQVLILDNGQFEELQAYKIVFEESMMEKETQERVESFDGNMVGLSQGIGEIEDSQDDRGVFGTEIRLRASCPSQTLYSTETPELVVVVEDSQDDRALFGEAGDDQAAGEDEDETPLVETPEQLKILEEIGSDGEGMLELLSTQEVSMGSIAECRDDHESLTTNRVPESVQVFQHIDPYPNHDKAAQESMQDSIMKGRESEATITTASSIGVCEQKSNCNDRLGSYPSDNDTICLDSSRHDVPDNYLEEGEPRAPTVCESAVIGMTKGPVRKEREWRRTLACKLFEERHNGGVGNEEGIMDMLWEVHETKESTKMRKKKTHDNEDDVGHGGEETVCCLQALKMSAARKVNLGMGRPNFVGVSKVLRRIGWLRSSSRRHKL